MKQQIGRGVVLAIVVCLAVGGAAVHAQSKTAKQSQSLTKAAEVAKKDVGGAVTQLGKLLEGYNSIIGGEAKNAMSSYKKLTGDMKNTEKLIQSASKSLAAMNKEAGKYFADWEKDLSGYSDGAMRDKSMARLETTKDRYAELGEKLGQAGEAFAPAIQNLNDQILFLGRDLSPEAIADLQDEAATLNDQVKEVSEQVNSLLQDAPSAEAE